MAILLLFVCVLALVVIDVPIAVSLGIVALIAMVVTHGPDALPNLRKLVSTPREATADFTERVLTVLVGVAVRRGEPWHGIVELRGGSEEVAPHVGMMHP